MAHLPEMPKAMVKLDKMMIIGVQVVFIILFGVFAEYGPEANVKTIGVPQAHTTTSYAMFQDIHVMIFIGFGFLMTFLRRYGFSSVGFNFLLASLVVQWAILCRGFFNMRSGKLTVDMLGLMGADISAAAVLISMGAVLGRTSWTQLLVMGLVEIAMYATNEFIVLDLLKVSDAGGSIVVHTFGAYFGLAVSFMLRPKKTAGTQDTSNSLEGSSYQSDIFAMIGTIFLFLFWPSFNGGLVGDDQRYRAIINTYLSLASATVSSFMVSALVSHGKFDMVHVQNSTLAGGVAVGAVCNLMIQPFGALLIGAIAGTFSVLGYKYLTPKIASMFSIQDTCGVNNLHGMPGIFSGVISAILALWASHDVYKNSLFDIYPALAPSDFSDLHGGGLGRTKTKQSGYQLLGLLVTLGISIVSGIITGILIKSPFLGAVPDDKKYDDGHSWELPANEVDEERPDAVPTISGELTLTHRKSDAVQSEPQEV